MDAQGWWSDALEGAALGAMRPSGESALLSEALALIGDFDIEAENDGDDSDGLSELLGLTHSDSNADVPQTPAHSQGSVDAGATTTPGGCTPSGAIGMISAVETVNEEPIDVPKKAPRGNRSRTRRKEELVYLRGLVGDLEERLSTMRKRALEQQAEAQKAEDSVTPENCETSLVLAAAWEQVATRQYEQRQRSEMENAKLRQMLEDQIQVGKSLERLLMRKRNSIENMAESSGLKAKRSRRSGSISIAWSSSQIFDELVASLDTVYAELPRVLAAKPIAMQRVNDRRIELLPHPEHGVSLETIESRILPFAYDMTAEEVWNSLPDLMSEGKLHHHSDVEVVDDLMKIHFAVTAQVADLVGSVNVKIVNRSYVEQNRTVIVSAGVLVPSEISGVKMDGVHLRTHVWHVVEPVPSEALQNSRTTPAATRVISIMSGYPEVFGDVSDHMKKVGTLTNFLLSAISTELDIRYHALTDRLIRRSLQ